MMCKITNYFGMFKKNATFVEIYACVSVFYVRRT